MSLLKYFHKTKSPKEMLKLLLIQVRTGKSFHKNIKQVILLKNKNIFTTAGLVSSQEDAGSRSSVLSNNEPCEDVAQFISTHSTSAVRYDILINHFCPPPDYTFPKGEKGRTFQHRWLQIFPWLVYSRQENGGYSLPCVLFALSGYQNSNPGVLYNNTFYMHSYILDQVGFIL